MPVEKKGRKVKAKELPAVNSDLEEEAEEKVKSSPPVTPSRGVSVKSPIGGDVTLLTQAEADFYDSLASRYQTDNMFKNVSDLVELDRILTMEVMSFRWSAWLLMEEDYDGQPVNVLDLQRQIREYAKAVLEVKTGLALDKKSRDANNSGTVADFIENLKIRAKEFGVHRDEQNYTAYNLLRELEGKVTLMKNATETERTEFEVHASQILTWFVDDVIPKLDELDEHFRENQRIWIRELSE